METVVTGKPKGKRIHRCLNGTGWIKTDAGTAKTKNNCNQCKFKGNTSKNMAERNSKVGIRTKIEEKIKLFNIAVKDGERTEMYVSSFFDK